jgi:hypothetical protein
VYENAWRRQELVAFAAVWAGGALFPGLAYKLRWPTRLRGWQLVAYVAFNTATVFVVRAWLVPFAERARQRHEATKDQLREELGREPTEDEVVARLVANDRADR